MTPRCQSHIVKKFAAYHLRNNNSFRGSGKINSSQRNTMYLAVSPFIFKPQPNPIGVIATLDNFSKELPYCLSSCLYIKMTSCPTKKETI